MVRKVGIIIPAHNEEAVIARCLEDLVPGVDAGEIEVVVVCNGCSDRTADAVRSCSSRVVCLETPIASKSNAIRLGEKHLDSFPRFYVDADVKVSVEAIRHMANKLAEGEILAIAPYPNVDLSRSSWWVRGFYRAWELTPYHRRGMIGAGVYGLSQEGRSRFGEFPDVVTDDRFVRAHFAETERTTLFDCVSQVTAPRDLKTLISVRSRSAVGAYRMLRQFPDLSGNESKEYSHVVRDWLADPAIWPSAFAYLVVNLAVRTKARLAILANQRATWARDEKSRGLGD